jgi:hypothetical protein
MRQCSFWLWVKLLSVQLHEQQQQQQQQQRMVQLSSNSNSMLAWSDLKGVSSPSNSSSSSNSSGGGYGSSSVDGTPCFPSCWAAVWGGWVVGRHWKLHSWLSGGWWWWW